MKMRVDSMPEASLNCNRSYYRFKVWEADQSEPSAWDLEGCGKANEPTNGSLLLVAHHVDASFGNVTVTPLAGQNRAAGFVQLASVLEEQSEAEFDEKPLLEDGVPAEWPSLMPADNLAETAAAAGDGPQIELWYGVNQQFGGNGQPIEWINLLGNVSGPSPIASLSYRLNDDPSQSMAIGHDSRRLADAGDFNIELPFAALASTPVATGSQVQHTFSSPGVYTVQLTVRDDAGATSVHIGTITVDAS